MVSIVYVWASHSVNFQVKQNRNQFITNSMAKRAKASVRFFCGYCCTWCTTLILSFSKGMHQVNRSFFHVQMQYWRKENSLHAYVRSFPSFPCPCPSSSSSSSSSSTYSFYSSSSSTCFSCITAECDTTCTKDCVDTKVTLCCFYHSKREKKVTLAVTSHLSVRILIVVWEGGKCPLNDWKEREREREKTSEIIYFGQKERFKRQCVKSC